MQRRIRKYYRTAGFKKALVQLKKGEKLAIFETQSEKEVVVTTGEGEPIVAKERKDILSRTKVKVERGIGVTKTATPRKVIGDK